MNEESLADASGEQELAWKPWFPEKRNFKACAPGSVGKEQAHVIDHTSRMTRRRRHPCHQP